jgi:prepilin-type N-terminal cleavage/methylation domain-containing protein
MNTLKTKYAAGLTLIEIMVVILIISIAMIGATSFRTYCVIDAKKADVQINAARVSSMLLETWKGMGGLSNYDPSMEFPLSTYGSQFAITKTTIGLAEPTGFTALASKYQVLDKANNVYYFVTLSYKPAVVSPSEPAALNATIVRRPGYTADGATFTADNTTNYMLKMTTYLN